MQQNFTPLELQSLDSWDEEFGRNANLVHRKDGKWNLYHVGDLDQEIDLVLTTDPTQAIAWGKRLGYEIMNKP